MLDQWNIRNLKTGRRVRQECRLSPILFSLNSECLTKVAVEVFGCFEIGGHIIHTVKKADDLVLLAEEENVTGDTINRSIEIRRSYGMEIYVERTKLTRI